MKRVTFQVTESTDNGEQWLTVEPSLEGIRREHGGEDLLLAIAANCVRMVATRAGLEHALERFTDFVVNKTRNVS